ncbi:hypothetical protein C0J52_17906, partial [Blattella germanica]
SDSVVIIRLWSDSAVLNRFRSILWFFPLVVQFCSFISLVVRFCSLNSLLVRFFILNSLWVIFYSFKPLACPIL